MIFEEFKQEVLSRVRKKGICDEYQYLMLAQTYEELLAVGKKYAAWILSCHIMDSELLKEVPSEKLLGANIYNETNVIVNPSATIYITNGTVELTITENNKNDVVCLGGKLNVSLSENAYCKIKGHFDSNINVVSNDQSLLIANVGGNSVLNHKAYSKTTSNIIVSGKAEASIEARMDSFVLAKSTERGTLNCKEYENAEINIKQSSNTEVTKQERPPYYSDYNLWYGLEL